MRWERVKLKMKLKEIQPLEGRKSPGRKGGILGPGKRWGHTCNSIKGGRFLYVFGGYGKDNCQTNDVHVFDTLKQTWSKPMVKGIPPSPRDSHSCTTVGNNLFVFGGTDGKNPLKDLHILDTITNTWMQPNLVGDGPDAREGHSAALIDKRLFIFGGCGKSRNEPEEVYYNDLYILDTESFTWKRAVTSGIPPSARDSHTCSSWRNKIIVLGGEDASDYYLSDVHILDADTLVWRELNTSGQMLAPRAGHATVALGKKLFVFGGFTDDRNLYDDLHVLDAGIYLGKACYNPVAYQRNSTLVSSVCSVTVGRNGERLEPTLGSSTFPVDSTLCHRQSLPWMMMTPIVPGIRAWCLISSKRYQLFCAEYC